LIVGGGAAGCELAGEIKTKYPEKEVTLVHGQPELCNTLGDGGFRANIASELRRLGVQVVLNQRITMDKPSGLWTQKKAIFRTSGGKLIESDMQFWSVGTSKPNVEFLQPLFQNEAHHVTGD